MDSPKRRGYRWSDGSGGRPRSWYVDVDQAAVGSELEFLKVEIYLREDFELRLEELTAFTGSPTEFEAGSGPKRTTQVHLITNLEPASPCSRVARC